MKVRKEFKCKYCSRDIPFGSCDAYAFDNEIFCCQECANEYANIAEYPWDEEDQFEYIPDESNGYGIRYYGDEFFSNGQYIIFDKCMLEIDDNEKAYFEIKINFDQHKVDKKFEGCELKQASIGENISFDECSITDKYTKQSIRFILNYTGNQTGLVQYAIKGRLLLIISNGIKAIIAICEDEEN